METDKKRIGVGNSRFPTVEEDDVATPFENWRFDSVTITFDSIENTFDENI